MVTTTDCDCVQALLVNASAESWEEVFVWGDPPGNADAAGADHSESGAETEEERPRSSALPRWNANDEILLPILLAIRTSVALSSLCSLLSPAHRASCQRLHLL